MNDFWIIFTAFIIAVNCGILGVFLMLRKMSMVGDAISHSVLPGIVAAYLIAGSRSSFIMLIGAALVGMLTTFIIEVLTKKARLQNEASIGITFTWMFAIGVIMIAYFTESGIDLDQECVLYGEIAFINLDKILIDGNLYIGPRVFWNQIPIFMVIALVIGLGYKGWKITTFNPDFAQALGIKVGRWHYLLMTLISLVTVMAFEAVGAILVVGFLVIPPATAYLVTQRLTKTIVLTVLIDLLVVIIGYYFALYFNISIAGSIVTASGVLFAIVFICKLFSKKKGVLTPLES